MEEKDTHAQLSPARLSIARASGEKTSNIARAHVLKEEKKSIHIMIKTVKDNKHIIYKCIKFTYIYR